jgi:hypothetical protein
LWFSVALTLGSAVPMVLGIEEAAIPFSIGLFLFLMCALVDAYIRRARDGDVVARPENGEGAGNREMVRFNTLLRLIRGERTGEPPRNVPPRPPRVRHWSPAATSVGFGPYAAPRRGPTPLDWAFGIVAVALLIFLAVLTLLDR